MDKELKQFLEMEGLRKDFTIKKLIKYILKYQLLLLILGVYYLTILILKAKDGVLSVSYGIYKPCKKCVWGKSRESLIIVSGEGYSRDNKVLQIMNYKNNNYTNTGDCISYLKCGKCLNAIDNKSINLICKWRKL